MQYENIQQYAESVRDYIAAHSNNDEDYGYKSHVFCSQFAFDILHESGDADNLLECHSILPREETRYTLYIFH